MIALWFGVWHDPAHVDQKQLQKKDIVGIGHLQRAFGLLERLHDVGCARDKAGNRELHFDQYCKLVLLYIWNPVLGSIGGLQQALGLDSVAKAVGIKRFSAGSFSESPRVFDPELLKPIIAELAGELAGQLPDGRLRDFEYERDLDLETDLWRDLRDLGGGEGLMDSDVVDLLRLDDRGKRAGEDKGVGVLRRVPRSGLLP